MQLGRDVADDDQQDHLGLVAAIRLAAQTPFYRARWGDTWREVRRPDQLAELPTISRSDVEMSAREMVTQNTFPDYISLTGGTTWTPNRGAVFKEYSVAEVEAYERFREMTSPTAPIHPLSIELISQLHGKGAGPRPFTFAVPLERRNHLAAVVDLLEREFNYEGGSRRVKVLMASLLHLQLFAALIQRDGIDTAQWALERVVSFGHHLSPRVRSELERVIGARVVNVFGLSEVAGSACLECDECGRFHIPTTVIGEFIRPEDDELSSSTLSELCLTSLAPFQTRQPLIRYRTGDLVEVTEICPTGLPAFMFAGRLGPSTVEGADGKRWVIPSALVAETIDDLPEAHRAPQSVNHFFGLEASPGDPTWRWLAPEEVTNGADATLRVHLWFMPEEHLTRAVAIGDRVRRTLNAVADRYCTGRRPHITVDVAGPPSLSP